MQKITTKIIIASLLLLFLMAAPFLLESSQYYLYVLTLAFTFVALAYSWGFLYYAGTLSLGHAGFFGLGAYTSALLTLKGGLSPWSGLLLAGFMAVLASFFLTLLALRLKGAYFALATLAFAEILKALVQNLTSLTNGPWGLLSIPPLPPLPFLSTLNPDQGRLSSYYAVLIFCLAIFLLVGLFYRSRWGLALACLRENPLAAAAIGINPWFFQALTLAVSAFLAGVAGALFAHSVGYLDPSSAFSLHFSAAPLIMALLGGALTLWGPLVGALGLYLLNELVLAPLFPTFHDAFYGLAVVLVFLFMPQGIMGKLALRPRGGD